MNLTDAFLNYLIDKRSRISDIQYDYAKKCLIDFICNSFAGYRLNKNSFARLLDFLPKGKIPIFGSNIKTNGIFACCINSFNAHSTELDDGNRFAMIHLGSEIISALVSLLEQFDIKTTDFYDGLIIGYEAACLIAKSIQPSHKLKGYHASGTCGTIGAAIACGIALNYNFKKLKTVLSCATTSASGLLEIQSGPSLLKPYNVLCASMCGFMSSVFGLTGLSGPIDVINGERGFLKLFSDRNNLDDVIKSSNHFEIEDTYFKVYSACRHCHPSIEASLVLRKKITDLNNIKSINVFTYKNAIKGHDHKTIEGIASAKLSIPYCTAVALYTGKCDLSVFTKDLIDNRDVLHLISLTNVFEEPAFTKDNVFTRQSKVVIVFKNEETISQHIISAKGEPENPVSLDEIIEKFKHLTNNNCKYLKLLGKTKSSEFCVKSLLEV